MIPTAEKVDSVLLGFKMEELQTQEVMVSDIRMASFYLQQWLQMAEERLQWYWGRYEESGRKASNEKIKAEICQADINTIKGWLERMEKFKVNPDSVSYLANDYTTKKFLDF